MNKTNLSLYFPNIYKEVMETKALIDVENKLFDALEDRTSEVENNQFVLTANERGLIIYERMLNIIANPGVETIQFRRERIINRLSTAPPYTLRYLKQRLNSLLGVDNYELELIYDEYILHLTTYIGAMGKLDELLRTLFAILPVNLDKTVHNKIIQDGEALFFIGQALDVSMVYDLTSDIKGDLDASGIDYIAQAIDLGKEYNLSADSIKDFNLDSNNKIGASIDNMMKYQLSSDINSQEEVTVEVKESTVISPGKIYNIE